MFSDFQYRTDKIQDFFLIAMIPCGLVARIRRFHRRGRGSIPRKGAQCFFAITSGAVVYRLIHDDAYACRILVH